MSRQYRHPRLAKGCTRTTGRDRSYGNLHAANERSNKQSSRKNVFLNNRKIPPSPKTTHQVPHPGKQPGVEHPPERGDTPHLLAGLVGAQDLEVGAQPSQGHQPRGPQQPNQGAPLGGALRHRAWTRLTRGFGCGFDACLVSGT